VLWLCLLLFPRRLARLTLSCIFVFEFEKSLFVQQLWITATHSSPIQSPLTLSSLQGDHALCSEAFASMALSLHHIVNWVTSGIFLGKDESLVFLDELHKTRLIPQLLHATTGFASSDSSSLSNADVSALSVKCQSNLLSVWSELVLSTSKFLSQVREIQRS
jgi:hypothetical protein